MGVRTIACAAKARVGNGLGWGLEKVGGKIQCGAKRLLVTRTSLTKQGTTVVVTAIVLIALSTFQILPVLGALTWGTTPVAIVVNSSSIFICTKILSFAKDTFLSPVFAKDFTKGEKLRTKIAAMMTRVSNWAEKLGDKCKVKTPTQARLASLGRVIAKTAILTGEGWGTHALLNLVGTAKYSLAVYPGVFLAANVVSAAVNVGLGSVISKAR